MTGSREMLTMQAADAVDKAIAEIADFDLKVEGATEGMPSINTGFRPSELRRQTSSRIHQDRE